MTKSYVLCLSRAMDGLLSDALTIFPDLQRELLRDKTRVSSLADTRGLGFYTLDLPAHLKHFDKCLSEGTYTHSNLPVSKPVSKAVAIPRLFQGLLLRVFSRTGVLLEDPDIDAISLLRQLYALGKKVRIQCQKEKNYESVSQFFAIESRLPSPDLPWSDEELDSSLFPTLSFENWDSDGGPGSLRDLPRQFDARDSRPTQSLLRDCQRVADILASTLGVFDPHEWKEKHGPGAVADRKAGENKYHFASWSRRLDAVFPYADFAFANYGIWADTSVRDEDLSDGSEPSRLICVPKTQKGPRLIAAEPTAHQWCQQALWHYFDTRSAGSWINQFVRFRDQRFNQEGARIASMSGESWTVDLSAASDHVSLRFVERQFRRNSSLLAALHAVRTRFLTQEIDVKSPPLVELKKYSTMGSACTFPVETLGFLCLALATVLNVRGIEPSLRSIRRLSRQVRVFGDDIIIPSDAGENFVSLLRYLSFEVNEAKTHRNGRFRESCGLEVFRGYDVTPAYLTKVSDARSPESYVALVECSNNFFKKGWWHAAEAIRSTVNDRFLPIVGVDSGAFGWCSFIGHERNGKYRINHSLQREERLCTTLQVVVPIEPSNDETALLQFFTEAPSPLLKWSSGTAQRPRIKLRRGWEPVDCLGRLVA